eukprot:CAMPEP_0198429554 /NCGR_PEP_ID=MMETSP1452-20131203/8168_1 /TAXON_ID=1181717 /ORGANISM="Synchroma pusillum, Strain CCMP3072" /LENGTH=457 /DNA_ID=CAMNT_0044149965 /DNA_START=4 /DNA_END=1377 /DNA_ORIENTATION=-
MIRLVLLSALLAVAAADVQYSSAALADEVTELPGQDWTELPFRQFSGYIQISDTKQIHYWFTESEGNPQTDPVVFWTNGGPGCSGLLGMFTEQGPFRPTSPTTLTTNQYAWNKNANMIFIEQPAGVGFSFGSEADYTTGDSQAAKDNLALIQGWLRKFDAYQSNDLYITSESYGGHYMPTLAYEIVTQDTTGINFKGFMVGNPYVDQYSGTPAGIATYWGHQLLAKPTYDKFQAMCGTPAQYRNQSSACELMELKLMESIGNLNPYALDYPVCLEDAANAHSRRSQRLALAQHTAPHLLGEVEGYQPCSETWMGDYFNQADVQAAINVKPTEWADCSNTIHYRYIWEDVRMEKVYRYLLGGDHGYNLKVLVYSGDDDSVCATVGTQRFIYDLGPKVTSLWDVWYVDGQTAGYLTQFDAGTQDFSFLTVHGAGHEVPAYKPYYAQVLFEKYLDGSLFA